jgi:hypothetical protein
MRDRLCRICEAYYNKAIGGPQVMPLLLRSQDLTLATVAVEHLTGAIALSARVAALVEEAQARSEQIKFCMGIVQSSVTR